MHTIDKTSTTRRPTAFGRTALGVATAIALAAAGAVKGAAHTDIVDLDDWDPTTIDGLWSADQLDDIEVRGVGGEAIGEVESIIIGADDNVAALVLEVGGLLDIGDTHLRVDWSDVTVDPSGELAYLSVPVSDDNYDQFDLFSKGEVDAAPREWRAGELIGDYVRLDDGDVVSDDHGYVKDLMFDPSGTLQAVLVERNLRQGGGYQAYPHYGYDHGFDPGLSTYSLPYGESDLVDRSPFDYTPFSG